MIKVVDERVPKKETVNFGDLKPGMVFQFVNTPDPECFWLFISPNYVGEGLLTNSAVQLFGHFETITALYDTEVIVLDSELHIFKGGNNV